ncbi:MAG: 4Fe-4S binding protein [Syntrophaceae bacterium]|nr:4Fe-4S binding protein [Syntrophaceae bacterium]
MSKDAYRRIAASIDDGALTAPKSQGDISEAFVSYLKLLYTPEQAELVKYLKLGINFTSAEDIARQANMPRETVQKIMDSLTAKGMLLGFEGVYAIPPIPLLLNHHQFYSDVREDDLKAAELYQQFFIKEGYYRYYEGSAKGTQLMRTIPVQRTLRPEQKILNSEEAHRIIENVSHLRLVPCPCRTRTDKMGIRECKEKNPVGYCIMTEMSVLYFEQAGIGKKITANDAIKYLDEMQDLGLVATTENFSSPDHTVICLCCQCCCSQLRGRLRWNNPKAVAPANFIAVSGEDCVLCGQCIERCMFGALSIDEQRQMVVADPDKCMGCGVCTLNCSTDALRLERLERERPFNSSRELYKTIAVENRE